MTNTEMRAIMQTAIQYALDAGCQEVKIVLNRESGNTIEWRDSKLYFVSGADSCNLTAGLFVNNRYSIVDTNQLKPSDLKSFITTNVENAKHLAPDPLRALPHPEKYYHDENPDLALTDPDFENIPFDDKSLCAENLCAEIKSKKIISKSASYDDIHSTTAIMTSNGFFGTSSYTRFSLSASVSVKGIDDERPEDYDFTADTHWEKLSKKGCGENALRKSLSKIGATRITPAKYDTIVDSRAISKLVKPLINALNGHAQYYKNSFLLNQKGNQILSPHLTIADSPRQQGMIGATYFDNDGIAANHLPIITNGRIDNYLISQYMGKKMQTDPTRGSTTILEISGGNGSLPHLIKLLNNGILITDFNGGNCNATTGDFSYGIEGYEIKNGIITHPIAGMLITGNMLQLWNSIQAIAADAPTFISWHTPSILFSGITIN